MKHRASNKTIEVILMVILCLFTGCKQKKANNLVREVTDMAGRIMQVPDTIKRVYTSRPGSILLYAVDPDISVCRSLQLNKSSRPFLKNSYINLPYTDGSVEEIMKLKPDIIISCFDINDKTKDEADRLSKKTGIPVFQVEIDMGKYPQTFDALGNLLYRRKQTDRMKQFVHQYLDIIAAKAKYIPEEKRVRVYYAEGENGLKTDPSGSKHSQIIDLVGAVNVAEVNELSGSGMTPVSMEQILLWNPDLILCWTGVGITMSTYRYVNTDKVWRTVEAVRKGKVYQIPFVPFGWFDRPPGTNRILGEIWTAKLLYPNLYNFDLKKVTEEYFELFYHRKLTSKELMNILYPQTEDLVDPNYNKRLKK